MATFVDPLDTTENKFVDPVEDYVGVNAPVAEPAKADLMSKLGSRYRNIRELQKKSLMSPHSIFRQAGEAAGGVGDIIGSALQTGYENIVPEPVKKGITGINKTIIDTPIGQMGINALKQGVEYWNLFKKSYPEAAKDIEATVNIASVVPFLKPAKAVIGEGLDIAKDTYKLIPKSVPKIDMMIDEAADSGLKTIISTTQKNNDYQYRQYLRKGREAVKDTVENKGTLAFTDADGEIITGKLPKTMSQFSETVYQRKKPIIEEANALREEAGLGSLRVELTPLADKLEKYANKPAIRTENPEAAAYALQKAELYRKQGFYTLDDAQEAMGELNIKLDNYLRSPSPQKAIDVISGNNIREMLNDAVQQGAVGGERYKQLRQLYGGYSTIEKDVTRKAINAMVRTVKAGPDFLDVISGMEFVAGLATFNPAMMVRAGTLESLNLYRKWHNNPNRYVKNMFSDVEKLIDKKNAATQPFSPESATFKQINKLIP